MNSNQIDWKIFSSLKKGSSIPLAFDKDNECSDCGELYEKSDLENCAGCGNDFCENCLNMEGYCSDCE